jgi:hypothetical protein
VRGPAALSLWDRNSAHRDERRNAIVWHKTGLAPMLMLVSSSTAMTAGDAAAGQTSTVYSRLRLGAWRPVCARSTRGPGINSV